MTPQIMTQHQQSDLSCSSSSISITRDAAAEEETSYFSNNTTKNSTFYYFLSSEAARELPDFHYRGQDLSLTYKYVLSPLAEFCVHRLTPKTVAPNTITLTGLLFMVAAYTAMWYYNPKLLLLADGKDEEEMVPRWVFLFNAVTILIYQTLDNMDGKQARRVGASSPLGLLFDHGCDAVNSVFGSANWITAMALTTADMPLCFAMLMGPYALFYVSTWEEYFTGALIMPLFNGPNEGLLGAVAMSLMSFFRGPGYWQTYSWWNALFAGTNIFPVPLRNCDFLVLASSIGFVQETTLKIFSVVKKYGASAALNLVPFVTLVACSLIVGLTDMNVWLDAPRTSLHLCAVLFVEMTTELMLAHMTKQNYQPFRYILLPLVLFSVLVATHTWPNDSVSLSTQDFLLVYASSAGMYLLMKTTILIHEICHVLDIWCFDIVTPPRRRKAQVVDDLVSNGQHHSKAK